MNQQPASQPTDTVIPQNIDVRLHRNNGALQSAGAQQIQGSTMHTTTNKLNERDSLRKSPFNAKQLSAEDMQLSTKLNAGRASDSFA